MRTSAFALALACAASVASCNDSHRTNGVGGGSDTDASAGTGGPTGGPSFDGCATASYSAQPLPAAMMVVLDRSSSMAQNGKWTSAAQAIVQALDADTFDSMYVGLYAAPTATVTGPACILNLPVACEAPPFPQVDLSFAGQQKSSAGGVRKQIKDWLSANSPDNGVGDASPMYAGLQAAIGALKAWQPPPGMAGARRMLVVVTDGTLSCNQFSSRHGFADCNGCDHDWEDPNNLVQLVGQANNDPSTPIDTFILGVPGADTYDASGCNYPPYHMRLALSAIAAAGSPANLPTGCTGTTFSQSGGDPSLSCHFDMTQGNFSTQNVAQAVAQVRGQILGCTYSLPTVDGGTVDTNFVNVQITANGTTIDLYKRKDPTNTCSQSPCWDWTPDGKVQLIGAACADVKLATDASVKIVVGCQTVIQ
jgi:hypothetical protein